MAVAIQLAGPAKLEISLDQGNAWQNLGYSRNGVEITLERYTVQVPSDLTGGDAGPPTDILFLGMSATIRADLTVFDDQVANVLRTQNGAGFGQLLFASNNAFALRISAPNQTWQFNRVVVLDPPSENKGSQFTTLNCLFRAYPDSNGLVFIKN